MLSFAGHSPIFDPERPGTDTWRDSRDPYHVSPTCSYCGSCSPEVLFAAIEAGHEIGPTDKGYKVYLELPNDDATALRVNGGSNGAEAPSWGTERGGYWKREGDMTDAERDLARGCGWGVDKPGRESHWINFGPAGQTKHGKFYFQHFSKADRERFLALHNDEKINFGYPGRLYARPYFAKEVSS